MRISQLGITGAEEVASQAPSRFDSVVLVHYDVSANRVWSVRRRHRDDVRYDPDPVDMSVNIFFDELFDQSAQILAERAAIAFFANASSLFPFARPAITEFYDSIDELSPYPLFSAAARPAPLALDPMVMMTRLISFTPPIADLPETQAVLSGVPLSDILA